MNKHTPAPWVHEAEWVYALERAVWKNGEEKFRNRFSARLECRADVEWDELEANARLMAAAPDLLEALQKLLDETDGGCQPCGENVVIQACVAIAKALGELREPPSGTRQVESQSDSRPTEGRSYDRG